MENEINNAEIEKINKKLALMSESFRSEIWKSQDGREIEIQDMSKPHILNTIECLIGKGKTVIPDEYRGKSKKEWLDILNKELEVRKLIYDKT